MGQRNATYIIIENKGSEHKTITPIYNQWNFVQIQLPKMARGIKSILEKNWDGSLRWDAQAIPILYYTNAGLNSYEEDGKELTQFVGGQLETQYYKDGTYSKAFQEDNNNGWNIVKFIINDMDISVEIYCVVGSEDKGESSSESIEKYFVGNKGDEDLEYLKKFKWNESLEEEAKELILKLIAL